MTAPGRAEFATVTLLTHLCCLPQLQRACVPRLASGAVAELDDRVSRAGPARFQGDADNDTVRPVLISAWPHAMAHGRFHDAGEFLRVLRLGRRSACFH